LCESALFVLNGKTGPQYHQANDESSNMQSIPGKPKNLQYQL